MGATIFQESAGSGVTFRVWAPFAKKVAVGGTFNDWSKDSHPLFPEGKSGYWSTDVVGAKVGDQYKFVISNPESSPFWRIDPYARSIVHDEKGTLNGVVASSSEAYNVTGYSTPSWNELVIYEIHVGTFSRDGGIEGRGGFTGVETHLQYLKDLGINAIELLPIGEFVTGKSSGYNPAFIFAIEEELGGPDGLRRFVQAAHQHGIAVIIDVVYNHLGVPADDMWTFDGWSENNRGGIYFYNDWRWQTSFGDRLDYGRPEVRQYLRDNALRWVKDRFADGLRFDSVGTIRNVRDRNHDPQNDLPDGWSLVQWINSEIHREQPWKITIAEDLKENEWITKSPGEGGAGFGAQWGSDFAGTIRNAVIASEDRNRDMYAVAGVIGSAYNNSAFQRVVYTENHDLVDDKWGNGRLPHQIWPGNSDGWTAKKRSTLAAAVALTAPGVPMLFQGQEFLSWEPF